MCIRDRDKARALYAELYKQPFHKKNLSISTKKVYKSSDTEKYVYELKDVCKRQQGDKEAPPLYPGAA